MINKSDVTIIIPTLSSKRNDFARSECLRSLYESDFPKENIIIVFNGLKGSGDEIYFYETAPKYPVEMYLTEQGQCKAVNAAAATVNTPWIMVSNDDHIFKPQWWEVASNRLQELENHRELYKIEYCLSPQLIEPIDGAPTFKKYFCGGVGGDWDKEKWLNYEHGGEGIRPGFNLPFIVRKEVFDLVGGYDINYDPWSASSDTDLQCKLELAGVKTYQDTDWGVYHFSQTSGTFHPDNHGDWEKNYAYFWSKWGYERPGGDDVWNSRNLINKELLKFHPWWEGFYEKNHS